MQQISIFAECPADTRSLNKKGIRKRSVKIIGVGWDRAVWYCGRGCGYFLRVGGEK